MTRMIAFASFGILGALALGPGAATAQAPTDLRHLEAPSGIVVGGGGATLLGGGDDRTIVYSGGGAGGGARYELTGRSAVFGGNNGGEPFWLYGSAPASSGGRTGWLTGGGDDSTVVYINPAQTRR